MYRHSPNLVLGLPNPLFSTWGAPEPLVRAQVKQLNKCWHPDKAQIHTADNFKDITAVLYQAAEQYPYNTTIDAVIKVQLSNSYDPRQDETELTRAWLPRGHEWEPLPTAATSRSRKREVPSPIPTPIPPPPPPNFITNTPLPRFHPDCECSIRQTLSLAISAGLTPFFLHAPPPETDADLARYCVCPISELSSTLANLYRMTPPRSHPLWDDPGFALRARKNPLLWLIRFLGRGFSLLYTCNFSDSKAAAWIRDGWAEKEDFWMCREIQMWAKELFAEEEEKLALDTRLRSWWYCMKRFNSNETKCGVEPGFETNKELNYDADRVEDPE